MDFLVLSRQALAALLSLFNFHLTSGDLVLPHLLAARATPHRLHLLHDFEFSSLVGLLLEEPLGPAVQSLSDDLQLRVLLDHLRQFLLEVFYDVSHGLVTVQHLVVVGLDLDGGAGGDESRQTGEDLQSLPHLFVFEDRLVVQQVFRVEIVLSEVPALRLPAEETRRGSRGLGSRDSLQARTAIGLFFEHRRRILTRVSKNLIIGPSVNLLFGDRFENGGEPRASGSHFAYRTA